MVKTGWSNEGENTPVVRVKKMSQLFEIIPNHTYAEPYEIIQQNHSATEQ